MWQQWTTFVLGLWLILAPFAFKSTGVALWGALQVPARQHSERSEHAMPH